jgi:transcriptional regulator with XRE-family HTH domain
MLKLPTGPWTGDQVRAAREALGLTQQELADALELEGKFGKDSVRNWEREKRPVSGPSRVAIRLMLEAKGVRLAKPKPKLVIPFKGDQPKAATK